MEKIIEIEGRKYIAKEPSGYDVDRFIVLFLDDNMNPIKEKLPDANVYLIKMVFGLDEEEIKALPVSVYRRLTNEAAKFIGGIAEDEAKK